MFVNQLAVFLENKDGTLAEFCRVLAAENIDIVTMHVADTEEFGILRAITRDNVKAEAALKKAGFVAKRTNLIGVSVKDMPGALATVLTWLQDAEIGIEYVYSYVRKEGDNAVILIKVDDEKKAIELLKEKDSTFLENTIL